MGACRNLLRHYGVKNRRTTREVLVNAGRRLVCRYYNQECGSARCGMKGVEAAVPPKPDNSASAARRTVDSGGSMPPSSALAFSTGGPLAGAEAGGYGA